jgi:hypothetical protein
VKGNIMNYGEKQKEEGKPKDLFSFLRSYLNVIQLSLLNIKVMPKGFGFFNFVI